METGDGSKCGCLAEERATAYNSRAAEVAHGASTGEIRMDLRDRIRGCQIGGAVGDALGAPTECLHYQDIRRILGDYQRFEDLTGEIFAQVEAKRGWGGAPGFVTDDTILADLLMDCIIANDGRINAYAFAQEWEKFEVPVEGPDGAKIVRLNHMHWIERIPYYRNRLREIPKRELGHGEANATNAIMYIAPVGLLCAGDPLLAELMAVDVTSVNQHGRPRDLAGAYAAVLAACLIPDIGVEEVVRIGVEHVRDWRHTKEVKAMIALARSCRSCDEYIERYYEEILGHLIPLQDLEHEEKRSCNSWNSAEVLGPVLAMFLITRGADARALMLGCAKIGRDADTICRCAGGLIGAYRGLSAIPAEWVDYVVPRNAWLRLEAKADQLAAIVEQRLHQGAATANKILGK
jgi:ADP-ribosylglycohydrolase